MMIATVKPRNASKVTAIASAEAPDKFETSVAIVDVRWLGALSLRSNHPIYFLKMD